MRAQELVYIYAEEQPDGTWKAWPQLGPAFDTIKLHELFTCTEQEHENFLKTQLDFEQACEHYQIDGSMIRYNPDLIPF